MQTVVPDLGILAVDGEGPADGGVGHGGRGWVAFVCPC